MTVTLGPVSADLSAGVDAWERAVFRLRLPETWTGAAADGARQQLGRLVDRGGGLLDRARALAAVLADVAAREPFDDARLAAALARAMRTEPVAAGPAATGPAPAAVAHWWAGLAAAERERLAATRPELVGALDGVPAAVRDRANRTRLAAARQVGEAELAGLERARDEVRDLGGLQDVEARLAAVRARLGRLAAIDAAVGAGGERALLAVDPASGRAAIAVGDVDRARHVGVVVPGFTARAEDLPGRTAELAAMRSPESAVVAWYDYPAPQWPEVLDADRSVLGTRVAENASARLASFLDGVAVAGGQGPHVTAVGHSYGSLTVAQGVASARSVDDVVLLGSPGVSPLPRQPTWVAEARGDPVADAGWFGPDPNGLPDVHPIATTGSVGHVDYLRPGSTGAQNVAAVIDGRSADVVADRTAGVGDRLRALLPR
ncbi:alpha/beta hydrolase [Actinomycetospora termitidis]|uniref:Alpha/beta hydrolase n=1 Tax=Actinomycetospora termitidis TaxID=3053470 RepID=A0ABT7M2A3_9PSEU|nr:alpha/beta hydrolase [Actinomycetospora sp. Odt1-22]MDL5154792.1 alpha/beta hydrolase [Actinomycetospora sp. Odt1-22]